MNQSEKTPEKNSNQIKRNLFLYPIKGYKGRFSPQKMLFDANLQELSQRINYIAGLHTNGKLSSGEAYQQIDQLWLEFRQHCDGGFY